MNNLINKDQIPPEVINTVKTLENKGFEAFIVGGCVRDLILNKKPKDWDITTNANPEQITEIYGENAFYENNFGTVGIKNKENEDDSLKVIEITPYRLESKYSDNRHPDQVTFSQNLEDDLKRRDFTMNALAYSVSRETLVDNFDGIKDIKDKIIKTVGNSIERLSEDSLRILRAVRFASELDFAIDSEVINAIMVSRETLIAVSRERISDEFIKIIKSKKPMIGLVMCEKLGLLDYISHNFTKMVGVDQNKKAHKFDVWEHSLRALQHSADCDYTLEMRLAALFHDIGKPATKRTNGLKTTFYGHEVVGERVTRETLKSLMISKEIIEKVCLLVRWHMFFSDPDEISMTAVRRLIAKVGEENIWDLMNLRVCDRKGMGNAKEEPYRLRKYKSMLDEALKDPISLKTLKINGDIMINELHMKPGRRIGAILFALFDEVLQAPGKNEKAYLINRVAELEKLTDSELSKLGEKGRDVMKDEQDQEIREIRKKHHVK
jgi:tRNA nucleotidyltransferase (CCA-adding enzyme)